MVLFRTIIRKANFKTVHFYSGSTICCACYLLFTGQSLETYCLHGTPYTHYTGKRLLKSSTIRILSVVVRFSLFEWWRINLRIAYFE